MGLDRLVAETRNTFPIVWENENHLTFFVDSYWVSVQECIREWQTEKINNMFHLE